MRINKDAFSMIKKNINLLDKKSMKDSYLTFKNSGINQILSCEKCGHYVRKKDITGEGTIDRGPDYRCGVCGYRKVTNAMNIFYDY